jgi:hypothetical protein
LNSNFFETLTNTHQAGKRAFTRYAARNKRTKNRLVSAAKISTEDIIDQIRNMTEAPSPAQLLQIARTFTTSSAWISHSYLRFLISHVNFKTSRIAGEDCETSKSILDSVTRNKKIPSELASDSKIFRTIYNELEFTHHHPGHKCLVKCPRIKPTIVLVSGVLNEIFSTAAFERGAKHLNRLQGINYITLTVKGTKSSKHNAKLIEKQLKKYIQENPNEKLWMVCFSKGGVDALHFLAKNSLDIKENLIGISTIATPILGTDHFENKLVKVFNNVHKFFDEEAGLLTEDMQQSLSTQFQFPWFSRNAEKFPTNIFYSAVAMESEWYESHLWMMLTKILFRSKSINDGVVDAKYAFFPKFFDAYNLGIVRGHHLVGTRSSEYSQEALLEAHIIFLQYKGELD